MVDPQGLARHAVWNGNQRRPRAWLRLIAFVAAYVAIILAIVQITGNTSADDVLTPMEVFVNSLVVGGIAYAISVFVGRRSLTDLGLDIDREWAKQYAFALFVSGGLVTLVFAIQYAFGWISISGTFVRRPTYLMDAAPWAVLFGVYLVLHTLFYSLLIEVFYRGFIYRNVAEGLHYWVDDRTALIASGLVQVSIFFAVNIWLTGDTSNVFFGVVGALIHGFAIIGVVYTGKLALAAGFRAGWNTMLALVFGFPSTSLLLSASLFSVEQTGPAVVTGGPFGPEGGIIGVFAALIALFAVFAFIRHEGLLELDTDAISSPDLRTTRTDDGEN